MLLFQQQWIRLKIYDSNTQIRVVLQWEYLIFIIKQKYEYFVDADKQVAKFRKQFAKGLFTDMKNILRLLLFETMLKIELNIEKIMNAPANTNNSVLSWQTLVTYHNLLI